MIEFDVLTLHASFPLDLSSATTDAPVAFSSSVVAEIMYFSVITGDDINTGPPRFVLHEARGFTGKSADLYITLPSENSALIFIASTASIDLIEFSGTETLQLKPEIFDILCSLLPTTAYTFVASDGVS